MIKGIITGDIETQSTTIIPEPCPKKREEVEGIYNNTYKVM